MNELIGKKIKQIFRNGDRELYFRLKGGKVLGYRTEGDCCSSSWFQHLDGIEALLDATVESIDSRCDTLKIDEWDSRTLQYGIGIRTDKGYATIEYRNSSNGYYGGWCELMKEFNKDLESYCIEVKEDF